MTGMFVVFSLSLWERVRVRAYGKETPDFSFL